MSRLQVTATVAVAVGVWLHGVTRPLPTDWPWLRALTVGVGPPSPVPVWGQYQPGSYVENPCVGQQVGQLSQEGVIRWLRQCSKARVAQVLDLEVEKLGEEDARDFLYYTLSSPLQGVCANMKRLGGRWVMGARTLDGARQVCMDTLTRNPDCLVYSFGISDDWDFEDLMSGLGCSVRAYDPSISHPPLRGPNTQFSRLGVGAGASTDPAWPLDTLQGILANNGHSKRNISYLKVDIEGEELASLPQWLDTGVLDRVHQLGLEFHLPTIHNQEGFHWLLDLCPSAWRPLTAYLHFLAPQRQHQMRWRELVAVVQGLYRAGFRVIAHDVNTHVNTAQNGYFTFFDVVFMKDNVWNHLDSDQVIQQINEIV